MASYRVWAPRAQRVSIVFEPDHHVAPMTPTDAGFFEIEDDRVRAGQSYWFLLDGAGPFPDPRSRHQPDGVHGPSRFFEAERPVALPTESRTPWERAVVYEMHVGTFTDAGTFDAAIDKLGHLETLGITHIELMPVAQFPGERGWGYDGVYPFAVQQSYGGPEGLVRFVSACHRAGLGVILDVVYNHLGPCGNYVERYGPYFTERYHTPWGSALNFDGPGSDEVRRFVVDGALYFLESFGIDGLRLDATHAMFDQSPRHILGQIADEIAELSARIDRPIQLVAEHCLNDRRVVEPRSRFGYGFTSQWSDDFHHALHAYVTGERAGYYQDFGSLGDVAEALRQGFVFRGQYNRYFEHGFGGSSEGLLGRCFLSYAQNHDQVGNRPRGDRLSSSLDIATLKVLATLNVLAPHVPMLFMGEEWGSQSPFPFFVDHPDRTLNDAVSRGRQREFHQFGWTDTEAPEPAALHTFVSARLDWDICATARGQELAEHYQALIRIRKTHPCLGADALSDVCVRVDGDLQRLVIDRGDVRVIAQFGPGAWSMALEGRAILLSSESRLIDRGSSNQAIDGRGPCALVLESTMGANGAVAGNSEP